MDRQCPLTGIKQRTGDDTCGFPPIRSACFNSRRGCESSRCNKVAVWDDEDWPGKTLLDLHSADDEEGDYGDALTVASSTTSYPSSWIGESMHGHRLVRTNCPLCSYRQVPERSTLGNCNSTLPPGRNSSPGKVCSTTSGWNSSPGKSCTLPGCTSGRHCIPNNNYNNYYSPKSGSASEVGRFRSKPDLLPGQLTEKQPLAQGGRCLDTDETPEVVTDDELDTARPSDDDQPAERCQDPTTHAAKYSTQSIGCSTPDIIEVVSTGTDIQTHGVVTTGSDKHAHDVVTIGTDIQTHAVVTTGPDKQAHGNTSHLTD